MIDCVIETAREEDIGDIMELEGKGFHESIREAESVFRARMRLFPRGFVVLRSRGRALGYLCSERWSAEPAPEADGYALGHDPEPRHDDAGEVLYLASMTLDPRLRGSGLGRRLFTEGRSLIHGGARGLRTELLIVSDEWKGARGIYEASGFAPRGSIPGFFASSGGRGAGSARSAIVMGRALGIDESRKSGLYSPHAVQKIPRHFRYRSLRSRPRLHAPAYDA